MTSPNPPVAPGNSPRWLWPALLVTSTVLMLGVGFFAVRMLTSRQEASRPTAIELADFLALLDGGRIESMTFHDSKGEISAVTHWVDEVGDHRFDVTTRMPATSGTGEVTQVVLRRAFGKHVLVTRAP